jgi:hypothetical protein
MNATRPRRLALLFTALAMLAAVAPTAATAGTKCSGGTHFDDAMITSAG